MLKGKRVITSSPLWTPPRMQHRLKIKSAHYVATNNNTPARLSNSKSDYRTFNTINIILTLQRTNRNINFV